MATRRASTKRTKRSKPRNTGRKASMWRELARHGDAIPDAELAAIPRDLARRSDEYLEGRAE